MSKTSMDNGFREHVLALAATAKAAGDSVIAGVQRRWAAPPGWKGNPLDVEGMTAAFDRSALGQAFEGVVLDAENPGSTGDAIALVIQNPRTSLPGPPPVSGPGGLSRGGPPGRPR